MARPREFDETEVIGLARDAFWCGGFAGTSVMTLEGATGLSAGSIYKAFSSKEELYRRSLDTYLVNGLEAAAALLASGETPSDGIRKWLDAMADQAAQDSATRGCFAVQAAVDLADAEPWVRERLSRHDERLRHLVADRIRQANVAGELDTEPDPAARMLCAIVNGLQVEGRKGITRADARRTLEFAFAGLPR
jgi:TetR/AcrR family transcriptional regulator, transcriptional repressor for nem operon